MRKLVCLLAATSFLLSGCGAILQDIRYPGGYPGYLLDRHSFNASSSKELILLRATIVLAMAARMGQATVRGEDADAFAHYLAASATEINYAAADLYPVAGDANKLCQIAGASAAGTPPTDAAATQACSGYRANFESELPLIEARLIKTVVAALPTEKARQFLTAATTGDVLGAAFKALGTFKSAAAGLHYANGSLRTGFEIVAIEDSDCNLVAQQNEMTVRTAAVTCLALPTDSIFTRTDHPLKINHVHPTAFDALMRIANGGCTGLPYLQTADTTHPPANTDERKQACGSIWFAPRERPVTPPQPAKADSDNAGADHGT